jgi:phosphoribosylformylglycinamidine (FGAM) synthase-like amidotransferase family enzyme
MHSEQSVVVPGGFPVGDVVDLFTDVLDAERGPTPVHDAGAGRLHGNADRELIHVGNR